MLDAAEKQPIRVRSLPSSACWNCNWFSRSTRSRCPSFVSDILTIWRTASDIRQLCLHCYLKVKLFRYKRTFFALKRTYSVSLQTFVGILQNLAKSLRKTNNKEWISNTWLKRMENSLFHELTQQRWPCKLNEDPEDIFLLIIRVKLQLKEIN